MVGFIGQRDMQGLLVGIGIYGNGSHAQSPRGLDYAAGDFTAIGNEQGAEHSV
jgi:hypothetical protein